MKLAALALTGLVAIIASAILVAPALGTDPTGGDPLLGAVRAISAKYHSYEQAERDGYSVAGEPCVASPAGGMGFHAVNRALVADPAIDPLRPEILLYSAKENGNLELTGVEYMRRAADQTAPFDEADKPTLFDRAFDGIMPEHAPGMGWHYDLHVWLWQTNPTGLLNAWNPTVTC
jgi:hypothetical protein